MRAQPSATQAYHPGVALLGWMERDDAIRFLIAECSYDPPLSVEAADELWQQYRTHAQAERPRGAPTPTMKLTQTESEWVRNFSSVLLQAGATSPEVVKVDPRYVAVGQYVISLDHADVYREACGTDEGWCRVAMPASQTDPRLGARVTRRGRETKIQIDLPHAEFSFDVTSEGTFAPIEGLAHVAVRLVRNQLVLVRGYHRVYARISAAPAEAARGVLIALESGELQDRSTDIVGPPPALFSDFFDPAHALNVRLRAKRYRLDVRAQWVAANVEGDS